MEEANGSFENVNDHLSELDSSLSTLYGNIDTLVNSSLNGTIDRFKEIESFLKDYSDSSTLTEVLSKMEIKVDNAVLDTSNKLDSAVSTMQGYVNGALQTHSRNLETTNANLSNLTATVNTINESTIPNGIQTAKNYSDTSLANAVAALNTSIGNVDANNKTWTSEQITTAVNAAKEELTNAMTSNVNTVDEKVAALDSKVESHIADASNEFERIDNSIQKEVVDMYAVIDSSVSNL